MNDSKVNDGGPAFPSVGETFVTNASGETGPQSLWGMDGAKGMSLRDYFAVHASVEDVRRHQRWKLDHHPFSTAKVPELSAEEARFAFADAMLRARDATPNPGGAK